MPVYCSYFIKVYIQRRLLPNGHPIGPKRLNILPSDEAEYDDEAAYNASSKQGAGSIPATPTSPLYDYSEDDSSEEEEEEDDDDDNYDNGDDDGDDDDDNETDDEEEREGEGNVSDGYEAAFRAYKALDARSQRRFLDAYAHDDSDEVDDHDDVEVSRSRTPSPSSKRIPHDTDSSPSPLFRHHSALSSVESSVKTSNHTSPLLCPPCTTSIVEPVTAPSPYRMSLKPPSLITSPASMRASKFIKRLVSFILLKF